MNNCNNDSNNNNNNSSSSDVMSWVVVIICLVAFWPLGLVLLLRRISFNAKKNASSNCRSGQVPPPFQRPTGHYQRYKQQQPYNPQKAYQQEPSHQSQQAGSQPQHAHQPAPPPRAQQPYTPYRAPQAKATYYSQVNPAVQKSTADKKPKNKKDKQTGKGLAAFLTFLGILFSVIGISFVSASISTVNNGFEGSSLGMLIFGLFFCLGGIISFLSRIGIMGRVRRVNKYYAILGDREVMSVADMAKSAGVSSKKLRKDLMEMADNGHFGESAYFDTGLDSICLSSSAAEKARLNNRNTAETFSDKPIGSDNQYVVIINELHMLCGQTIDPTICSKIQRIEELTSKIFRIVEDNPEKAPQIRRFMNYYLPTTLKLLHSYETLEKQGVNGENIMSAKQDIERILETLATGYEQQLDNLFKADKIDISADINVLENLMEQDGLTNEGNILKTAGGN